MISESRTPVRTTKKIEKKSEIKIENVLEIKENTDNSKIENSKNGKNSYDSSFLEPNNFVCTTAVKAYGRRMEVGKALALLSWMESKGLTADIYLLSSLLFVCAKTKRVTEAENIFWHQIPARNLTYSVATTNSLMYMYAKLNRPDDALKVYELAKGAFLFFFLMLLCCFLCVCECRVSV